MNKKKNKLNMYTYLKGYKFMLVGISFLMFLVTVFTLWLNDFKFLNAPFIISALLTIFFIVMFIIYLVKLKEKGYKSESIIFFNQESYIEYDVTNLRKVNLANYPYLLSGTNAQFNIVLFHEDIKTLVWVFKVLDKNILTDNFNKELLDLLNNNSLLKLSVKIF